MSKVETKKINNKIVSFTEKGDGFPIVLLHGYLETLSVWGSFAEELSEYFRVICIDIPGHGGSEVVAENHSMELMAKTIDQLLEELGVEHCLMIGHSMGGYVTLAYANDFANRLKGFVLFHSGVFADNDEKKQNRLREIDFIKKGKKDLIFNVNLPKVFADDNVEQFAEVISAMQEAAKTHSEEGICALLRGMMDRKDQQKFVTHFDKPMLFIFGEKDNFIPVEAGKNMLILNDKIQGKFLEDTGHMGFVEAFEESIQTIKQFASKCAMA